MNRRNFMSAAAGAALVSNAVERVRAAAESVAGRPAQEVAMDEDFWFQVRHAFSIDRNIINLNNGSVAPAPKSVQNAVHDYLEIMNMQPSYYVDEMLLPGTERVRQRLAATFGCDPEEMALMRNTTEAVETVQFGLDLKPGDEILTTSQDYPSMLTTWRQIEQRRGVVLKTFPFPVPPPSTDDLVERFERAITPRTKVIMMCHVTYTTGQIFPVGKICRMARARGIETLIDGAHGFAHFPFKRDDLDCDYYGTSLHKWLSAPIGTGFLYVRRDKISKVWPLFGAPADSRDNIRKFEGTGTTPVSGRNAITEAVAFLDSIGLERKAARLRYLRQRWANRLATIPRIKLLNNDDPAQTCAIGAVSVEGIESGKLTDHLMQKYRIHVRPRYVPGEFNCLRVTPNVYTSLEEIDKFAEAMEVVAKKGV
jgi:isopenicillin-N epimerase